uniref:VWFA domain-containing protein n=1 Tax=viral metagenome TaxID=1070528 RepID=A0A6C0ASA6_9ZZZZ
MSSIIENTLFTKQAINFDPVDLNTQLVPAPLTGDIKFGIIDLKALSSPLTEEILEFIFQLDRSGSMSDLCSDGRTKMQHIIHTMSNIVTYFRENTALKVFITVEAFDDKLYSIVARTNITEENYKEITKKIEDLTPRGSTDIGIALNRVKEISTNLRNQFPDHKLNHIFMTDGQITQGVNKYNTLSALVDSEITNAFIGFGIDHDAVLLNALSADVNSNYYFIDKLENAGLVYGEILHGIVYRFLTDVIINISEGLIYNFRINEWGPSLSVGEIVSESNKTYHIVSNSPAVCSAQLICRRVLDDTEENLVILKEEDTDLTKYIFRQRNQQHLFAVKEFIAKKKADNYLIDEVQRDAINNEKYKLKQILRDYFKELKKYVADNNLSDDIFYQNLCDDIYISIQTFTTLHGVMYINSRLESQGTQRAYNVTSVPIRERRNFNGITRSIRRQNAMCGNQMDPDNYYGDDDDEDQELDLTLDHQISSSVSTPYRSSSQTVVMRSVSNNTNDFKEDFTLPI